MDSGYYAAYSALLARTEAMDAASSNLANANTNGYRAQREYFRDAVAGEGAADLAVERRGQSLWRAGRRPGGPRSGRTGEDGNDRRGHPGPGFLCGEDSTWRAIHARRIVSADQGWDAGGQRRRSGSRYGAQTNRHAQRNHCGGHRWSGLGGWRRSRAARCVRRAGNATDSGRRQ